MNLSNWAIQKPVPAVLLFIVLSILGWMSFNRLSVQNLPDMDLPTVTITASLPGSSASSMETEVTRKIEDSVASLDKIEHITSTVNEGSSVTSVQFALEKNSSEAVADVRDAVSKIRSQLPGNLTDPVISKVTLSGQALLTYAVESKGLTPVQLSWFIDNNVTKALLSTPGVSKVSRAGGVDREVLVELDPVKMAALNVTAHDVSQKLRSDARDVSGGKTEFAGTEQTVRALGASSTVKELSQTVLALPGARRVALTDIATITDGTTEPKQLARLDGKSVVAFQVFRSSGNSEVTVSEAVRARIAELGSEHPEIKLIEIGNSVERVQVQYDAAMRALYEGAILAIVVVWVFLRDPRATFLSAVALPLSILPTFFAMEMMGFSLNTLTLLALTLVVGVLVDDAIVEVENIVRHQAMGKSPLQAAKDAAAEIGVAVIATSLTLVAVFLPTAFMGGIPGKFFKQFGWTTAIAVMASLLVARLLTPLMAARMLKPTTHEERQGKWTQKYRKVLDTCLVNPWKTVGAATLFFVGSVALMSTLPSGFIPPSENGKVMVALELAPGARLSDTDRLVEVARSAAMQVPEVSQVFAMVGNASVRTASLTIELKDDLNRSEKAIEAELRTLFSDIPGAKFSFGQGSSGEKLSLVLSSDSSESLQSAAQAVEDDLRRIPGLGNVNSSARLLMPELKVSIDKELAADLGVSMGAVGDALRVATTGDFDTSLAKLNLDERQLAVRVRLNKEARENPDLISQLKVNGNKGAVSLGTFATFSVESGPAQIERYDRRRNVTLSVELAGKPLGEVAKLVNALPSLKNLPEGVSRQASGESERMAQLFSSFGMAMAAGVLAVYLVLVLLFHDFSQPLTILAALPLSIGGAVIALLIGGYSMSMPVLIGLLMLMGIVTKNSILLVEYAARLQREKGLSSVHAMQEACSTRARPVLMTTIAMIAGMAPMALATSGNTSFSAPMATAVIGGLLTSTLLSLFVVPAVYTLVDTLKLKIRRIRPKGDIVPLASG